MSYIDSLKRELADVTKEFDQLLAQDLPGLNESLKSKGQQPVPPPPAKVGVNKKALSSGGPGVNVNLPADFRLLR
jgi:hypothetical protein